MNRIVISFLILAILLAGASVQAAPIAQGNAPEIVEFTTTAAEVSRAALQNRSARIPVSWEAANRPITSNLFFEQVLPDGSAINVELPRLIPWVASSGGGVVAPIDPAGSVEEITLRVRLVDLLTQQVYDESEIILPVVEGGDPGGPGDVPTITRFTTVISTVFRDDLTNGTARIGVSWTATNRPLTANLIFEQVIPGTGPVNVELPRENPWVASEGDGVVAPRDPGKDQDQVWLRVRLVDLVNGRVYHQRDQFVNISDEPAPQPTITSFTTTATGVSQQQLAAETARVPVSWAVENRPPNSNLVFEQVLDDGTVINVELPRTVPIVPSSGNGTAAPVEPGGDAEEIVLQVRLINLADNSAYDTAQLTLPIVDEPAPQPAITSFTTTATNVSQQQLASQTARVPVSWAAENRPPNSNLVFEQVLDDGSVINVELPRTVPIVPSSGNGTAAPVEPGGSAEEIVLQVRLINLADNSTYDTAQLTLPIVSSPGGSGNITSFTTNTTGVDAAALQAREARIPVSWAVQNRPANTNLVFEQRLANGSVINVELPRTVPIVPSSGNGVTNPMWPGGGDTDVLLILRLVNLSTNQTLDSAVLSVPILNMEETEEPGEEAGDEDETGSSNEFVNSFSASPSPANPQSTITLSWDVQNAASVTIIPLLSGGVFGTGYDNLPISGTQQHTIAAENTEVAEFILSVENDQGQEVTTQTLTVPISCEFSNTHQDGCPISQEAIQAAFQSFQNGAMVWRSDTNQVSVLYNDGTYITFPHTWTNTDPVDTGETPPSGLVLPVRGFGKVWANETGVRDALGWATAPQQEFNTTVEVYIVPNTMDTAVLSMPDGRILSIGQSWSMG